MPSRLVLQQEEYLFHCPQCPLPLVLTIQGKYYHYSIQYCQIPSYMSAEFKHHHLKMVHIICLLNQGSMSARCTIYRQMLNQGQDNYIPTNAMYPPSSYQCRRSGLTSGMRVTKQSTRASMYSGLSHAFFWMLNHMGDAASFGAPLRPCQCIPYPGVDLPSGLRNSEQDPKMTFWSLSVHKKVPMRVRPSLISIFMLLFNQLSNK